MSRVRHVVSVTAIVLVPVVAGLALHGQDQGAPAPIIGRWDLTVTGLDFPGCAWLEVQESGRGILVGRFVGWSGSARPISRIEFADGVLRFAIPPQWEAGDADLRVEGRLRGDTLGGTMLDPAGNRLTWGGRRAPALQRNTPAEWASPIALFDGGDLSRWESPGENWRVSDGVLRSVAAGSNLVTRERFGDFKLHLEFMYQADGNSGVYLRGHHEVQIEDSPASRVRTEALGAVYGFLPPSEDAARGPDQWQEYDITLVGRHLTVTLNGVTVISNREIPGLTGGALSCDEGAPGPLMLQGDHGPIAFRNIVLTPAK
jgi:3-keto-disaccharide hydrolase